MQLSCLQRIAGAAGTAEAPLSLAFDPHAFALLDSFLAEMHGKAQEAEGLEAGWIGKGRGTVVRLAAALALLAWSDDDGGRPPIRPIGRKALSGAIELWQGYFWPHARTVFDRAGHTARDREARRLVRWLRQQRMAAVTRQDLRRDALGQSVDAAETDRIAARLEDAGVLRLDMVKRGERGRPVKRWLVNPRLLGGG